MKFRRAWLVSLAAAGGSCDHSFSLVDKYPFLFLTLRFIVSTTLSVVLNEVLCCLVFFSSLVFRLEHSS